MLNYVHQFIKIRVVFHTLYLWNEAGDPNLFYISGTSNSLSDCSKNFKKIYIQWNIFARTSIRKKPWYSEVGLILAASKPLTLQTGRWFLQPMVNLFSLRLIEIQEIKVIP